MKLYKLTDHQHRTYGNTQWGENVTHTTNGDGALCGPGWLHAYMDPHLAIFLNPIHADFAPAVAWEAEGAGQIRMDRGLKIGVTSLTTLHIVPCQEISRVRRIRFGILCAAQVCNNPTWRRWAQGWLDNTDRSERSATRAAVAVDKAAAAMAADMAEAAMWSSAAAADKAAWTAEWSAWSGDKPAWSAAAAADMAAAARKAGEPPIDFVQLAHRAMSDEAIVLE